MWSPLPPQYIQFYKWKKWPHPLAYLCHLFTFGHYLCFIIIIWGRSIPSRERWATPCPACNRPSVNVRWNALHGIAFILNLLVFSLETFLLETFDNDKWHYQNNDGDNVMDHVVRLCSFFYIRSIDQLCDWRKIKVLSIRWVIGLDNLEALFLLLHVITKIFVGF